MEMFPQVWCDFCYALETYGDIGYTPAYAGYQRETGISRFLFESKSFVAIAGLGQIVEGYVLLLTKEHVFSMAHLPTSDYFDELEDVTHRLCQRIAQPYSRPIIFEHGPMPTEASAHHLCEGGGSCMDHAHLHLIPLGAPDSIAERLQKRFPYTTIQRFADLASFAQRDMPYIFFESATGRRIACEAPSAPSQYVRQLAAEAVGLPERWNWHVYPEFERVTRTVARLAQEE